MNKKLVLTAVVLASVFSVSFASGEPPAGAAPAPVCQSVSEIDISTVTALQSALNYPMAGRVDNGTYCLKFNIFRVQRNGERIAEPLQVSNTITLDIDRIFSSKLQPNRIHLEGLNLKVMDGTTLTGPILKIAGVGDYTKTVDMKRINLSDAQDGLMIFAKAEVNIADSVISCFPATLPADRRGVGIILKSKKIKLQNSDISECNIGIQIERGAEGTLIGALTEDDVQENMNRIHANNTGIKWTDGGSTASISTAKFAYNSFFDNSVAISIDDSIIARLGIPDPLVVRPVVAEGAAPEDVPNALNCERDANDAITSRWINVAGLGSSGTVVIYQYDGGGVSSVVPQPQNFLASCEPHSDGRCYFDWDGSLDSECGDENLYGIALAYDSDEGYTTEASAPFRLRGPRLAVGPVIGGDVPTTIPGAGPVATGGGPITSELGGGPGNIGGDSTPEYLGGNDLADKIDENAQGLENSMGGGGASETGGTSAEAAVATSAAGGCGGKSTIAPSSNERLTGILTLLWWLSLPLPLRAFAKRRMGRK